MSAAHACDACLARSWLLERLGGNLEHERGRIELVLELEDDELIEAVGGGGRDSLRAAWLALDTGAVRAAVAAAGLEAVCRCDPGYPPRLRDLLAPPAVLFVAGGVRRLLELVGEEPVAIVGSRRASGYGAEIARSLGRELAVAGVNVVSGMAVGIDAAAHEGALAGGRGAVRDRGGEPVGGAGASAGATPVPAGATSVPAGATPAPAGGTVAVLPGPADRAYPASHRRLYNQILDRGVAVSELPPGASVWRWTFLARNRIIAGLSTATVVVEARERSGALVTARFARELQRPIGAVPGLAGSPLAAGPHALLRAGATLVAGTQDVLDLLFGAGVRPAPARRAAGARARAAAATRRARRRPGHARGAPGGGDEGRHGTCGARRAGAGGVPAPGAGRPLPGDPVRGGIVGRAGGCRGPPVRAGRLRLPSPLAMHTTDRTPPPRGDPAIPRVLSIAGSDSGGGAGIQADLKAFAICGVHGMTAITAITAQNTVGVSAVHHIPGAVIVEQVRMVQRDIGIDAVKIGMLGTVETIDAVALALDELPDGTPVVLDPVMVAESGAALLDPSARETLVRVLLPRATVVTPNMPEARALTGAGDMTDAEDLAREIHGLGPHAVVVTGGHRERAIDVFYDGTAVVEIPGERYPDGAAHGSGCTHSSVLAARLAWGDGPLEAARAAKRVTAGAVRDGLWQLGEGAGPVDVLGLLRRTRER